MKVRPKVMRVTRSKVCISGLFRRVSERSSIKKKILNGSRRDKKYYGKFISMGERKLLGTLFRAVYDHIAYQSSTDNLGLSKNFEIAKKNSLRTDSFKEIKEISKVTMYKNIGEDFSNLNKVASRLMNKNDSFYPILNMASKKTIEMLPIKDMCVKSNVSPDFCKDSKVVNLNNSLMNAESISRTFDKITYNKLELLCENASQINNSRKISLKKKHYLRRCFCTLRLDKPHERFCQNIRKALMLKDSSMPLVKKSGVIDPAPIKRSNNFQQSTTENSFTYALLKKSGECEPVPIDLEKDNSTYNILQSDPEGYNKLIKELEQCDYKSIRTNHPGLKQSTSVRCLTQMRTVFVQTNLKSKLNKIPLEKIKINTLNQAVQIDSRNNFNSPFCKDDCSIDRRSPTKERSQINIHSPHTFCRKYNKATETNCKYIGAQDQLFVSRNPPKFRCHNNNKTRNRKVGTPLQKVRYPKIDAFKRTPKMKIFNKNVTRHQCGNSTRCGNFGDILIESPQPIKKESSKQPKYYIQPIKSHSRVKYKTSSSSFSSMIEHPTTTTTTTDSSQSFPQDNLKNQRRNTIYSNYFNKSFYALNIQVENNHRGKYACDPYECEPGTCYPAPGQCDPIECDKLIKRRLMGMGRTSKVAHNIVNVGTHSVSSGGNTQYNYSISPRQINPRTLRTDGNGKHAVRIDSRLNLNIEFSKKLKSHRQNSTNTGGHRAVDQGTHKRRFRGKDHGTHAGPFRSRHADAQSEIYINAEHKRCFCTLKLHKMGRLYKEKSVAARPYRPQPKSYRETGTETIAKVPRAAGLQSDVCEPKQAVRISSNFSFSVEFSKKSCGEPFLDEGASAPYVKPDESMRLSIIEKCICLAKLQTSKLAEFKDRCMCYIQALTDKNKPKIKYAKPKTSNKSIQIKGKYPPSDATQMREFGHNTKKGHNLPPLELFECDPGICTSGQCDPYRCIERIKRRGRDLDTPMDSMTAALAYHKLGREGKQAVRVGSAFNFNVEFNKCIPPLERNAGRPHMPSNRRTRSIGMDRDHRDSAIQGEGGIRHQDSQVESPTYDTRGNGGVLKRCLCTAKLHGVHGGREKSVVVSPPPPKTKKGRTIALLTSTFKKKRKNTCDPECVEARANIDTLIDTNDTYLDPDECEPSVCVTGECDPYSCYERIKRRHGRQSDQYGVRSTSTLQSPYHADGNAHQPHMATHYDQRYAGQSSEYRKSVVFIGSQTAFNINFKKRLPHKDVVMPRPYRTRERQHTVAYNEAGLARTTGGYQHTHTQDTQIDPVEKENKGSGVGIVLRRCFCTLALQGNK